MKNLKALLAERLATEQVIQSIETRVQSGALTNGSNGSFSVSMPIIMGELKRLAQLRGKLAASDGLLGTSKSRTGCPVRPYLTGSNARAAYRTDACPSMALFHLTFTALAN